jgi:prepilin-type N-terminal cleavage/methylation domain-containing protein
VEVKLIFLREVNMFKMKKNQKGFTLIELLIVVAIIAILAAIAIPQFATYRMRGYNAAANSDIRNTKTAEEALFADYQTYGRTEGALPPALGSLISAATAATGGGVLQTGPRVAATTIVLGAMLSGPRAQDGLAVAIGTSVSNNVSLVATDLAPVAPALSSSTYIMAAKHLQGDREFAAETESTAISYCQNGDWAGTSMTAAGIVTPPVGAASIFPAASTTGIDVTGGCGGAAPIVNWSAL